MALGEPAVKARFSTIRARERVEAGIRALSAEEAVNLLHRPALLAQRFSPANAAGVVEARDEAALLRAIRRAER